MRKIILTCLAVVAGCAAFAQRHPVAVGAIKLINEARANPALFLKNHKAEITERNPTFAKQLSTSKPLEPAIWDAGLETMCKIKLDGSDLDPEYKGKNDLCGNSSGMHGTSSKITAMDLVFDFYTNVLDPNSKYLGIAFDTDGQSYWYDWGYRCDKVNEKFSYKEKVDSSSVDFAKLNTAKDANYMTAIEKRMVLEINFVRAYPKVYAQIIAVQLDLIANGTWGLSHDDYVAGLELIDELNAAEPMTILEPMQCVFDAAKAHGVDCGKRGFLDHTGSNGSAPWDRILQQCPKLSYGNENLEGSGDLDARKSVISLLIDGGISNRGHRYNMLDPSWRYVGCYLIQGTMKLGTKYNWVQNFGR